MTIVIETGIGTLASANSYVTLATADAYFESRGYTTWTDGDDDLKEYAIINACLLMEVYPWRGQRALSTDPLAWPRRSMQDRDGYPVYSDTIPNEIKKGQMELAFRLFNGKSPYVDIATGDGYVTKEVIGPVEITYASGYSTSYKFPEIDALLSPWLDSSLSVILERA